MIQLAATAPDVRSPRYRRVIAWSREHLAGHKYPRIVKVVEDSTRPVGQVLKRELVARYRS